MNKKSFYHDSSMNTHMITIFASLCMLGFTLYLTNHYFAVKYPTGLVSAGLCDINSYFNCDAATNSPASNLFGVPISLFGLIISLLPLAGYIFKTDEMEGTVHSFLLLNAIGCLVLFVYSIIALGSLCPFCTLYYIASWLTAFMFYKNSTIKIPALVPSLSTVAIFGLVFFVTFNNVEGRKEKTDQLATSLIDQYKALKNLGQPSFTSQFVMTKGPANAPIKIVKFSDFECPACKMLSEVLHKVEEKYGDKVNIQYFFYPLDNACNPAMKTSLHRYACKAAYLATCMPSKFKQFEKDVFANQQKLSDDWLESYAKKENVTDCYTSQKGSEIVKKHMEESKKFNVRSTPTFMLNGVKIEGVLPLEQLSILIDHLLK